MSEILSAPRFEIFRPPYTYTMLDQRQKVIAERIRNGGAGAILIAELNPVITLGNRVADPDFLLPEAQLRSRGIEILKTNRGGLATYHGPGQWVVFVVGALEKISGDPKGVRKSVMNLLELASRTATDLGVACEIREGCETGVWTKAGKLASVGVKIDRGILQHGLCLNIYRTPESFFGIDPCGLKGVLPDYLLGNGDPYPKAQEMMERSLGVLKTNALSIFPML